MTCFGSPKAIGLSFFIGLLLITGQPAQAVMDSVASFDAAVAVYLSQRAVRSSKHAAPDLKREEASARRASSKTGFY